MSPLARAFAALCALLAALLLPAAPSHAAKPPLVTAHGHFTAATDNPAKPTAPRGSATFKQRGGAAGRITGTVHLTGMMPNTNYVTVPYVDPVCTPAPGVTAYPSSQFVTDATGAYNGPITVNPASFNPLGTLDISQVKSVSIRGVLASPPPPGPPTIPDPVFEACDTMPSIN